MLKKPLLATTDATPNKVDGVIPDRCSMGGSYKYVYTSFDQPAQAVYQEPCNEPPTHRYRGQGFAEGHWNGRCAKHVGILDTTVCTIEPL